MLAARRGFSELVDYLTAWSTSNPTGANSHGLSGTQSDKRSVEGKLHALVQDLVVQRMESERKALRAEIIRDVAHNLNSPIASLAIRVQKLDGISPDAAVSIHEGLSQISGIVAKLKYATSLPEEPALPQVRVAPAVSPKVEMLSALLDSITSDKRVEKANRSDVELVFKHTTESYGAFAAVHALDFRVVLSNLLNNAYDSIERQGEITVRTQINENQVRLLIQDTGQGIPQNIADQLFAEGFSYGKEAGTGRGLFHAKKTLAAWGGDITIQSSEGRRNHGHTDPSLDQVAVVVFTRNRFK